MLKIFTDDYVNWKMKKKARISVEITYMRFFMEQTRDEDEPRKFFTAFVK